MRVFVTGASGFIGSAVVKELMGAGHQVLGLARSDASAEALTQAGAAVHRGTLEDVESLKAGVQAADATIHLGFIHDFTKFAENCEIDRRAIEAMGSVLAGKPMLVTSGTGLVAKGRKVQESDRYADDHPIPRIATEQACDAVLAEGGDVRVIRLPQVHADGKAGFVTFLIDIARQKGTSAYMGDGENCWPACYRDDAATLYRLVLEQGEAGARYHAVGEDGVRIRDIAELIGRRMDIPVVSLTPEQAPAHFGWFALFTGMDNRASSAWTRQTLGWQPTGPGLIDDMNGPTFFTA